MYIRKKSQRQESRTAKEFSGNTQIASGAIETLKGDVRTSNNTVAGGFSTEDFLIENKFTDSPRYLLTLNTWNKISREAFRDNFRTPLMQIDVKSEQLVVMDSNYFQTLELLSTKSIQVGAKSFPLKEDTVPDFGIVQLVFLQPKPITLYVMHKQEFLDKLG